MTRAAVLVLLALACGSLAACGKGATSAADKLYKQENKPDNLQGLIDTIVKAQESGDLESAATLANHMVADADTLKKAFKDDVPEDFMKLQVERLARFPSTVPELANLLRRGKPHYTQSNVHVATAAEISAGATPSALEFSNVPRDFAANLRPDTAFYAQEFVEPGKEAGRKHLLFLWDGSRWRMLGPSWR